MHFPQIHLILKRQSAVFGKKLPYFLNIAINRTQIAISSINIAIKVNGNFHVGNRNLDAFIRNECPGNRHLIEKNAILVKKKRAIFLL